MKILTDAGFGSAWGISAARPVVPGLNAVSCDRIPRAGIEFLDRSPARGALWSPEEAIKRIAARRSRTEPITATRSARTGVRARRHYAEYLTSLVLNPGIQLRYIDTINHVN